MVKFLRVGLFNAGSLGTNHEDFLVKMEKRCVDIMAINETWLRPGEIGLAPVVSGYRLRHIPRPPFVRGGRGGGTGFYIKSGIKARIWQHPVDPKHRSVEQMWLTMSINGKKIAIGTAYRPPWMDVDIFFDALTDSINSTPNCDNVILLGDFNINLLDSRDGKVNKLNVFTSCLSLTQLVSTPTHYTDHSQTLIDVICTDLKSRNIVVEPVGSINGHCFISCEINIKKEKVYPNTTKYRPMKDILPEIFAQDLNGICWEHLLSCNDVNEIVNHFSNYVKILFDLHAPVKTVTIKKRSPPWITDTIRIMMHKRDAALSDYRYYKTISKKEYYISLKSLVYKSLFYEKSAYFKYNINNQIHNPKQLWKKIKSDLLPFKNRNELPQHFTDPNIINQHFLNIPGTAGIEIPLLTYYLSHKFGDSTFTMNTLEVADVVKIMKQLKSNAEGYDGVTLIMLLSTFPQSLEALTRIINCSIETSTFPDIWKVAVVRPIPKNNNPQEVKDLRPISILPCISKIVEKAVCQQLTIYLERNNILPELQSGFRKNRSTATALLDVTDNLLCAQDKGLCSILVLLDFSRAFDSINVELLISKLSYYGFDQSAQNWFNSYLSNRFQFVELKNSNGSSSLSQITPVIRGVPQGSILGPILFSLYCADITSCLQYCQYHIYADDVQIYISFKPDDIHTAISKITADLNNIVTWSKKNNLILNPLKTKYLIFGSKHKLVKLPQPINIFLMDEPINRVYEARNLGLLIDSDLRFEKHVTDSVQNCFYRLKVLYKIRLYLSEELRIQLIESLVLSKLNYSDAVFGPRLLKRTQRLIQRVQNACARFCFSIPPRAHVTPFLNQHCILRMKARRKLHLATLLFGVIKFGAPSYLYDKLIWFKEDSRRKCCPVLAKPQSSSAAFRGSFRYAATKCWNNIPPPIRDLTNIFTFKIKLKRFLLIAQREDEYLKDNDRSIF